MIKEEKKYDYKSIKYRPDKWQVIKDFADELSAERGDDVSLPAVTLEAVKFMKQARATGRNT